MKSPFNMKTALQKVAGQFSETLSSSLQDGKGDKVSVTRLIKQFSTVIDILEKENSYLLENNVLKAMELFPRKKTLTAELHDLINEGKTRGVRSNDALTEQLKETEMLFRNIAQKNQDLLKQAITTQEEVMKIVIESAVENNRHGYNRAGTMGSDTSRAAFSLNDQI